MDSKGFSLAVLLFVLLIRFLSARKDECFITEKFKGRKGFALTGYVITSTQVPDVLDCSFACLHQEPRCQSYNFQEVPGPPHLCELSNETMETKPDNYQDIADMTYYDAKKKQEGPGCSSSPCKNGGKCINTCDRFPFSFHCECQEFYTGGVCEHWAGDFDFTFPTKSVSNYVNSAILSQVLSALTFCIWFQTTQSGIFGLVSGDLDLSCEYNGQCVFYIENAKSIFYGAPLNDGAWHSVCVTWQKSTSTCTAYVDGKANHRRSFDSCWGNSDVIFDSAPLVLGQSMSSDGAFLEDESFTGNITRVNLWDYAMNEEQVKNVATNCSHATGNILRWPLFRNKQVQGSVVNTGKSNCVGADISSEVSIKFAAITNSDRIVYFGTLPDLQSLTLCFWVKIAEMVESATPFSYANSVTANALFFVLFKTRTARLFVNNEWADIYFAPFLDKHWHHLCVTWKSNGGELKGYVDGRLCRAKTGHKSGAVIKGGGKVILGQDQDIIGGSFSIVQSLAGIVSHMNMWDFVLRKFALVDMATGFGTEAGNIVAWKDLVTSQAYGQVEVVPIANDPPKHPLYDFKYIFPTPTTDDFVQLENATIATNMNAFTVCLWVKVPDEVSMAFFTYRTTGHRNEITMRPAPDKFSIIIKSIFLHISYTDFFGNAGWQHVCFKWGNSAGDWKLYMYGEMVKSGTGFQTGKMIKGSGTIVLGQRYSQGDVDELLSSQSFKGDITHLNIWNMTLGGNMIRAMARGSDYIGGNWFDWSTIYQGQMAGSVTMVTPTPPFIPDEVGAYNRDKVCEVETKDGCESPVYALFDGASGKKWRCYFNDAITVDTFGLRAYDKLSGCRITKDGLIDVN